MCSGSHGDRCLGCKLAGMLASLLLALAVVASALGVWWSHHDASGLWMFGTTAGSAALVTFILAVFAAFKVFRKACPCGSKGGCGCAGGCGDTGACHMCGKDPCVCK